MPRRARVRQALCPPRGWAVVLALAGCGRPITFETFPSCEGLEVATPLAVDDVAPAGFSVVDLVNHMDGAALPIHEFETYDEGNPFHPAPGPVVLSVSYAGDARAIVRDEAPSGIAVGRGTACLLGDLVAADVVVTYETPGDGDVPPVSWTVRGTLEATSLDDPYLVVFDLRGAGAWRRRDLTADQEALVDGVIAGDGAFEGLDWSLFGSLGYGDVLSATVLYRDGSDHRSRWLRGRWGERPEG